MMETLPSQPSMVELIAKAMYESSREWWKDKPKWEELTGVESSTCKEHWYIMAKAALYTLLDPTDEMIEAGHMVTGSWWDIKGSALTVKRTKMKMRWQGMIKEALKS